MRDVDNIFGEIADYEQKRLCVFIIDTFGLKNDIVVEEIKTAIQRILDELQSGETYRERIEIAFISYDCLTDEISIFQDIVSICNASVPPLTATTNDTSLTKALYMALDVVETQVTWYKSVGIPYYRPWIFLISNGMSLLSCNVDEIASRIEQDTINKKYVFLPIYTKDANVTLLQEIESDIPITALDSLNITDCFKWLSSSEGEVCSSNSDSPSDNCDWMDAFTIGESCGSSEICSESSGSIGLGFESYNIDNESNTNDLDVDFDSSHSCSGETSSELSSGVGNDLGCYDIDVDGNIDDWNNNLGSSVGFGSNNNGFDHSSFDWLEGLLKDSDNNSPTTFESNPLHLRDSGRIPQYISAEEGLQRFHKDYHDKAIEKDVYSSLFSPAELSPKSHMLVQVYLHLFEETEKVKSLAQESDKRAERRDYMPLQCKLKKGDKVDALLNIYGETLLMSDKKSVVWQGSFTKCSFDYFVPKDIDVDELSCVALLTVNNIPVGEMRFITRIVESPRKLNPEIIAHKYNKVFISYAHKDEAKVKSFHEGLKLAGIEHFFDRAYLKTGDVFPQVIQDYIDSADLFVLFWSENAAQSDYVQKERSQALERAFPQVKPQQDAKLSIYPMSIEPRAELPSDMKENYHFGEI